MIQYTQDPPHPFQPKSSKPTTKVMDFDTFVLPDGVGKVIGLTVVPLAASMRKCHVSRLGSIQDPVGDRFFSLSLVG